MAFNDDIPNVLSLFDLFTKYVANRKTVSSSTVVSHAPEFNNENESHLMRLITDGHLKWCLMRSQIIRQNGKSQGYRFSSTRHFLLLLLQTVQYTTNHIERHFRCVCKR